MSPEEISALEYEVRMLRRENAELRARLYVTGGIVVAFFIVLFVAWDRLATGGEWRLGAPWWLVLLATPAVL